MMGIFYHSTRARRSRLRTYVWGRASALRNPSGRALALLAITLSIFPLSIPAQDSPPYSPERSMATMRLERGFGIQLVASEPDVQSPVAMDFDEDGRLFVVEMPGYPLDVSPSGRVKLLEDADGDGRFERATVFADRLVLPTGVMRWKKGVLVTAAPDVLYLEDSDGDGRADVRKVVLTGFPFTNPQHTVNTPLYGLDNWIYVANQGPSEAVHYRDLFGDRGTRLTFPAGPKDPGAGSPRSSVRFRPDSLEAEAIAGESQFGHTFDAYGRYFGNDNSHHLWHEVMAARYLRRNPHLLVRRAMHDVPDHGAAAAVYPITEKPTFELLTEAGEFTSASAPTFYLGDVFPAAYRGSVFVAEPVHNVVHRDVVSADGATFTARRAEEDREFLAARDAWFRPVFMHVGPDGALYVVDYYRARIEHPEWTASDVQRDPRALYEGRDRGRIYRIVHEAMPARRGRPALGSAATETLVAALADPNVWWRRTAQRLLVDRSDPAAVTLLRGLARSRVSALARLHALWTLRAAGGLEPDLIVQAMSDPDPGVRENAIVLAELEGSVSDLADRLVEMANDADPRVRFQVLAALGGFESPQAVRAHEQLLFREINDRWMQLAGLSARPERAARFVERALAGPDALATQQTAARAAFIRLSASIVAARGIQEEIGRVIALAAGAEGGGGAWWRAAALDGVADGLGPSRTSTAALHRDRDALLALAGSDAAAVRRGALRLLAAAGGAGSDAGAGRASAAAERTVMDAGADADRRADAVALLALDGSAHRGAFFRALIDPRQPDAVQVAAILALSRRPPADLGSFLLSRWAAFTPAVRSAAADALIDRADSARLVVDAIRAGVVQPWGLNFWQKRDLLMHDDEEIRRASRALLEEDPEERQQTLQRYSAALTGRGDAGRGEAVFARACAACHSLGGGAGELGPDLATVRHRPPLLLLADILSPSLSIAQNYETYAVERTNGVRETGLLAAQTPTTITLRQGPGREVTIPRPDIKALTALPESAMPADLEKLVTPEEMGDLLVFLKSRRVP
jgi:putative membrane-bound dehydrogenase-like protein